MSHGSYGGLQGEMSCDICKLSVSIGRLYANLQCDARLGCGKYFHSGCLHVDPDAYQNLVKTSRDPFFCPDCFKGDEYPFLSQLPSSQAELCSVCHRAIREGQELITCDVCEQRSHRSTCNQLTKKQWQALAGPITCWRCKVQSARESAEGEVWHKLEALANMIRNGIPGIELSEWDVKIIRSESQVVGVLLFRLASLTLTPFIAKSLRIDREGLVSITIHGHSLPADHEIFGENHRLDLTDLPKAVRQVQMLGRGLESLLLCTGNRDEETLGLVRMGLINPFDDDGSRRFFFDTDDFGAGYTLTLRSAKCPLLFSRPEALGRIPERCSACFDFRHYRRKLLGAESTASNFAALSKKALVVKLKHAKKSLDETTATLMDLKKRMGELIEHEGRPVDDQLEKLLVSVTESQVSEEASSRLSPSQCLFMLEQIRAAKAAGPTGRRWHPAFVSFCLALKMRGTAAYEQLAKFVALPSARRLYDFSHHLRYSGGIDPAFLDSVVTEYKSKCSGHPLDKYVVLAMDGMYVQSGLTIESGSNRIVGYAEVEGIDQTINDMARGADGEDRTVAKEVFTIMLKGIAVHFSRPIASWPTKALSGHEIGTMVWAVTRALWMCDLVVKAVSADGATSNYAFFDQAATRSGDRVEGTKIPWKTRHPYDRSEEIFFVMDPPHLVKLNRNSLANSNAHECTRSIEKVGPDGEVQRMDWDMIRLGYQMDRRHGPLQKSKLTHGHVELNSYSKMSVRKAAQVCSATFADVLEELDQSLNPERREMSELVTYLRLSDQLFDLSNVRHAGHYAESADDEDEREKPMRAPFSSLNDPRLDLFKQIQNWFYGWREENTRRYAQGDYSHFISGQSFNMMMLNTTSIPAFIRWGLSAGYKYILTAVLNTDDVEALHAELRQFKGSKTNPTVSEVFSALPQNALAKQALKAVSVGKGTNVDTRLLADPGQSSSSAYAQRLASVGPLPSRPRPRSMEESAAKASAPKLFEPKTFHGRMLGIVPHQHRMDRRALKPHEVRLNSKQELKTSWKAELALLSPDKLSVYKIVDAPGKESKSLSFEISRERFEEVIRGTGDRQMVIVVRSAEASSHPYHHVFLKLQAGIGDSFSQCLSDNLGQK